MAVINHSPDDADTAPSNPESRGHWQLWVGAFVLLGSLFTVGWAVVETWWG